MVGHDLIASGKQAFSWSVMATPSRPPRGPSQLLFPLGPGPLTTKSPPLRGACFRLSQCGGPKAASVRGELTEPPRPRLAGPAKVTQATGLGDGLD